MHFSSLMLAIGLLTPALALPGPNPAPTTPSTSSRKLHTTLHLKISATDSRPAVPKPAIISPAKSCLNTVCLVEQTYPVWDPVSHTCICRWKGPFPAPDACADMLCIAEQHVVYDQATGTCGCEWIAGFGPSAAVTARDAAAPVDPATCPTIRCATGYHAVYQPSPKLCTCEPDAPDPATCPTIKCTATTEPVYHPETKRCSCEPKEPVCPNVIFCAAGSHKRLDPKTKRCVCVVTNPIPTTCPLFKCVQGTHVVYHPATDKCACETDCPDLMCIAEQRPVFQPASSSCSCQWIPGLEPGVTARDLARSSVAPAPTRRASRGCRGIFCIAEQHAVFNASAGRCECEWIPGLSPSPSPSPLVARASLNLEPSHPPTATATAPPRAIPGPPPPLCDDTFCLAEMEPVFDPETGVCECRWLPGLEPGSA